MFRKSLVAASLIAASVSTASAASYGFFDARSVAMGNTSVATGGLSTAAFANPAMLAINESDDTFALIFPAIGIQFVDNGGMIDKVDDFQALVDQFNAATTEAEAQAVFNQLDALAADAEGDTLIGNASVNAALVYGGDSFSIAASFRGYGQASAGMDNYTSGNFDYFIPANNQLPSADFIALGYAAQEVGVSIASDFKFLGMKIAWGVTPKSVTVDAIEWSQTIDIVDTADVADTTAENLGSFVTLDAGMVIQIFDSLSAGVVAKNLVEKSFVTTVGGNEINFNTQLRAGVSYHNDWVTLAADMDLAENDPISPTSYEDPTQMMSFGAEFDAFDILQLRAGYQTNIASGSTDPDLISAGVGLWLGFNLDIAAVVAEDSSYGVFVQSGFRF